MSTTSSGTTRTGSGRRRLAVRFATAAGTLGLVVAGVAAAPAQAQPAGTTRQLDARTATLFLLDLAPAGTTVGGYVGQQSDDEIFSSFKLDRGKGPVELQLNVQADMFTPAEAKRFYRCSRDTYRTCEVKTDVDGSYLLRATRDLPRGGRGVEVDLLRGDGTRVVLETGNTADVKYGGPVHGSGVSVKWATGIVQSPRWQLDEKPTQRAREEARRFIRPWTLLAS